VRGSVTQFDLPLAPLAPSNYQIELSAETPSGEVRTRLVFRVTS
jgi:hypothetical protein